MVQITVSGVNDDTAKALSKLSGEYDVPKSKIVRSALRNYLKDRQDLPEWLKKELRHEILLDRNNWRVRVAFLKSNMREFFNDALDKELPPDPEKMEWAMEESYKEQIQEQVPEEWQDEYENALQAEIERYHSLHPDTLDSPGMAKSDILEKMVSLIKYHERTDLALDFAKNLRSRENLPENVTVMELMNEARHQAERDKEGEWDGLKHDFDHKERTQ